MYFITDKAQNKKQLCDLRIFIKLDKKKKYPAGVSGIFNTMLYKIINNYTELVHFNGLNNKKRFIKTTARQLLKKSIRKIEKKQRRRSNFLGEFL